MKKDKTISNRILIFRIVIILLFVSIITLLLSVTYIKKTALDSLAQDDAKKTAQLIFETMNTKMQEGWGKDDLTDILNRLEHIREGMNIHSYRSEKVEEILGIVEDDKLVVNNDKDIQKAMKGEEIFQDYKENRKRFLYPIVVRSECITCHYNAKVGDINGVLEVTFLQDNIKISLESMSKFFILFFIIFMAILFVVFYVVINKKLVLPITHLNDEIIDVAKSRDLTKRVAIESEIKELKSLQKSFNTLLETIKYFYDKTIDSLNTDNLTKLSNTNKLREDLNKYNNDEKLFLSLINIAKFSQINQVFGVKVGDFILKETAKIIKRFEKDDFKIYRLHGDEFAILTKENISIKDIQNFQNALNNYKFKYKDIDISISINIGYVFTEKEKIIEKATAALEKARASINASIIEYDTTLNIEDEYANQILWTKKLEEAIKENRIVPVFQPIYDVKKQKVTKYETLMRLKENEMLYTPNYFLDVAYGSKMYPILTQLIIKNAFKIFSEKEESFSLNFDFEDILNKKTVDTLIECLEKYNIGKRVIIELLETKELDDYELLNNFISRIKEYNVLVAIDDFGSGYSNYSYLLNLNVDIIKLDSSLVEEIDKNENTYKVVKNIILLAKELDLEVVAEKVHSQEIQDILTKLEVTYLQGFHIGKPKVLR